MPPCKLAERQRNRARGGVGLQEPWWRVCADVTKLVAMSARRISVRPALPWPRRWLSLDWAGTREVITSKLLNYILLWFINDVFDL
jgi:hypothetical protein